MVSNLDSADWPSELRSQFEQYVQNGGGFVVVHAADNAFPNWPAYNQMTGIGGWRGRTETAGPRWYMKDGKLVSDTTPGKAGAHGARLPFQITVRDPEHPIMKGLPPVWMHAPDELYGTLRGPGENMTILATAHSDPQNKGTGNDEPMLMVRKIRKRKGLPHHPWPRRSRAQRSRLHYNVSARDRVGRNRKSDPEGPSWLPNCKRCQLPRRHCRDGSGIP